MLDNIIDFMLKITIEKNDDGFLATCPDIEGAFAEDYTEFDALYNLFDVIKMINHYKKEQIKTTLNKPLSFTIPIAI